MTILQTDAPSSAVTSRGSIETPITAHAGRLHAWRGAFLDEFPDWEARAFGCAWLLLCAGMVVAAAWVGTR